MMLHLMKKVRVPTKQQIVHEFRTDWKKVGVISYADTSRLFKVFEQGGRMEYDAELLYVIYKLHGEGTYRLMAWAKGYQGFWNFLQFELGETTWRRLPKNIDYKERLNRQQGKQLTTLRNQLKKGRDTLSVEEKKRIVKEIEHIKRDFSEDLEVERMLASNQRQGTYPYLKQTKPIYRHHSYKPLEKTKEEKEVEVKDGFW